MRSGQLRHTITVERSTESLDEYGSPAFSWAWVTTLRAAIVQRSAEEFMRTAGQIDETVVVFHTRFHPEVRPSDRVVWRSRTYDIREVSPDGHEREMEIRTVTA